MNWLSRFPAELILWLTALLLLAAARLDGLHGSPHFSLCPLAAAGLSWCPGCGLGRAVTQAMHGNFRESLQLHLMGIPAILIIGARIGRLSLQEWNKRIK